MKALNFEKLKSLKLPFKKTASLDATKARSGYIFVLPFLLGIADPVHGGRQWGGSTEKGIPQRALLSLYDVPLYDCRRHSVQRSLFSAAIVHDAGIPCRRKQL